MAQLSKSVQHTYQSKILPKLNMHQQRLIRNGDKKN